MEEKNNKALSIGETKLKRIYQEEERSQLKCVSSLA